MRLKELLAFDNITVQCHDNPDADALASGFAVWKYLHDNGKNVEFVYSGKLPVKKSNLVLMIEKLNIPVKFVSEITNTDLLVAVDSQYGGGNITRFDAENVAVIDHHQIYATLPELADVRSGIGSCSTICYDLLRTEGVDINEDKNLATALYYGLYTDTSQFSELYHPLDRDLRDEADFDRYTLSLLRNSNISFEELSIASDALANFTYIAEHRYGIVEARPCDPNILGIISDMFLEVDKVDSCLIYSILPFGVKFSIRSCIREINAGELADYIATGIGSGGGHANKAGGFLQRDLIEEDDIRAMLAKRMLDYYSNTEIIDLNDYKADVTGFLRYVKQPVPFGYVPITSVFPAGKMVHIRTLEGDLEIESKEDVNIIIGIKGEVYPITPERFKNYYVPTDETYYFNGEYAPLLKDPVTGEKVDILPLAKCCYATSNSTIYAKPLDHRVKIFTHWDRDKYSLGKPGDFLAVRGDNLDDVYIIEKSIFFKTYEVLS